MNRTPHVRVRTRMSPPRPCRGAHQVRWWRWRSLRLEEVCSFVHASIKAVHTFRLARRSETPVAKAMAAHPGPAVAWNGPCKPSTPMPLPHRTPLSGAALGASLLISTSFATPASAEAAPLAVSSPAPQAEASSSPVAATAARSDALTRNLLGNRVSVGGGAYSAGYGFNEGAWNDAFATQHLDARWRLGGWTVESGLQNAVPLGSTVAAQALTAHLRLGWTGARGTLTAGAMGQFASAARPATQLLPTVTAAWRFDRFGLSGGLFDVHGLAPVRISFEHTHFGFGYVAPLGAEAHGRFNLAGAFDLQVQGMAFRAFNAQVFYLGLSGVFVPKAAFAGGRS